MSDTRSMSYAELADALDMTPGSVRNLVRRKRWQRVQGNDGRARVHVPLEALEGDGATDAPTSSPTDAPTDGATSPPTDAPSPLEAMRDERDAARAELADVRVTLADATARLEAEREKADALRERMGEAHDDRDRWAAMADALRADATELRAALEREVERREDAERRATRGVLARLLGRAA